MPTIPIIFEDDALLVINKPAPLLVHGLHGRIKNHELGMKNYQEPTVVDWLLYQEPQIAKLVWPEPSRPGIVHRLDRDTSGVMVIAKNPEVLNQLQQQFQSRTVQKTYQALVVGEPTWEEQTVRAPISRSDGTRRTANFFIPPDKPSKPAETFFRVLKRYFLQPVTYNLQPGLCLVEAQPKTGRTNQIRVHLQLLGHPILGDPWYETKQSTALAKKLDVPRLMLHANQLSFVHPQTGEKLTFEAPIPKDIQTIIETLGN